MTESMLAGAEAPVEAPITEAPVEAPAEGEVSEEGQEALDNATKTENEEGELILGKFKDQATLEESYTKLEEKLMEKGKIPPEKYEPTNVEGDAFDIPEDDPMLNSFTELATELGMTQEAYSKVIGFWQQSQAENAIDPEAEMGKLGKNGKDVIDGVSAFYTKHLSEDEMATLGTMSTTAEQVKVLDKLRGLGSKSGDRQPAMPVSPAATATMAEYESKLKEAHDAYDANPHDPKHMKLREESREIYKRLPK